MAVASSGQVTIVIRQSHKGFSDFGEIQAVYNTNMRRNKIIVVLLLDDTFLSFDDSAIMILLNYNCSG